MIEPETNPRQVSYIASWVTEHGDQNWRVFDPSQLDEFVDELAKLSTGDSTRQFAVFCLSSSTPITVSTVSLDRRSNTKLKIES